MKPSLKECQFWGSNRQKSTYEKKAKGGKVLGSPAPDDGGADSSAPENGTDTKEDEEEQAWGQKEQKSLELALTGTGTG